MSIIIFSKNYASSTFCLDELVQILDCYTKQKIWVLPVFYDIEPSHVRHQTGTYEEAFATHERGRFKDDIEKMQKWRLALRRVADLSGSHFKIREEYEFSFIKKITEEISSKLNRSPLHIADYPVGLQARMQQIQRLMGVDFDNKVTMLGIHGMGGIGKSTLARAMYNLMAHQFEASCFLADVRAKSSTKHDLLQIQETMLSELVGERNIKLGDVYRGIPILQHRLCRKKVLVVLDDIDQKEQLQATAGGLYWFGSGSIIIITTRDKHLLDIHGVEKLYEVNELDDVEAHKLFSWNAFKNKKVDPNYKEIIKRAIYYARGLPLALEIIGSNLLGKALDEWKSALQAYERIPNRDVQKILRVSYDSLDTNEKEIFLDIACFFQRCTLTYVTNMLEARGFHPKFGIRVLEEKSLVKIDRRDGKFVIMHDLIQSMGREIVRQQSYCPQKRNRLLFHEDIVSVLEKHTENDEIEAMMLDMPEDEEVQWNQKVFGKMKNLRMLLIKKNAGFFRSPKVLPNSLRVLEWFGYPESSLPSNFHSKNLVILNLSYSYFQWDKPLQNSKVLRHLILKGCKNIRRVPDMSGFPNLTELCVGECTNLIEIHDSVGSLHNLERFCAEGCTKLVIGPRGIKLTSLEHICLRNCSSLVMFPEILAPMHKLKFVDLEGTAIKNLPRSVQNLEGLRIISLKRCKMLESNEPSNFVQKLPEFFPHLTELCLQDSNLTILPACIEQCHFLQVVHVHNCKQLQEIRGLPPSTINFSAQNTPVKADSSTLNMLLRRAIDSTTISYYILPGQQIPEWFDCSSRGNSLCFWFRNELPSLTACAVSGVLDNIKPPFHVKLNFFARINDVDICVSCFCWYNVICISENDHIFMFNLQNHFHNPMNSDIGRALKRNEWIRGNVSFVMTHSHSLGGVIKWTGVYVNRAFSRMENVRFTDPNAPNKKLVLLDEAPEIGEQPLNYVSSNLDLDSQEPACTTDNDQDGAFLDHQAMAPSFAETQNVKAKREMGALISQVSREFTHQSRDYIETSMKIEFTASESHNVDEVEPGLETRKKQISKAMALEDEVHKKLSMIKKMKEDLGEQLSAIKVNISAIQANNSSIKANISSIKAIISASQSERNMDSKIKGNNINEE
ncbi:TMV resistance protein N, partial [Mucuna pruriens]